MTLELRSKALQCLSLNDPDTKCQAVKILREQYLQGQVSLKAAEKMSAEGIQIPGRPEQPLLVNPGLVKRRSMVT
jgi:uncharacterized ferritin-like protein (DUF455 family)